MQSATIHALNQLNLAFYEAIADDWTLHRNHAWPGFDRVLTELHALARATPHGHPTLRHRVLDVGAGDGRFALYLLRVWQAESFQYLGIDGSPALLATARARTHHVAENVRWQELDFVLGELDAALAGDTYSLISLFGVLHHVPSLALRQQLIARLAERVQPNGLFAMTFWRLPEDARFQRRILTWEEHNRLAQAPLNLADLEPGDTLLRWGTEQAAPRYCHFADEAEIQSLIAASGLQMVTRFRADGRDAKLNDYVLLTRRQA